MVGKIVTKLIQSLPTWEVTKYYGRVCIYQLKCLKYKVQTSEAWFNFKCKFMPGSLRNELECEETIENKVNTESKRQKVQENELPNTVKSHNKIQYDSMKDTKDSYILNEFVNKTQNKKENRKYQDNEKYTMHEECMPRKQRKAKRAQ